MDNTHRRAFLSKLAQLRPQYVRATLDDVNDTDIVEIGDQLAALSDDASSLPPAAAMAPHKLLQQKPRP